MWMLLKLSKICPKMWPRDISQGSHSHCNVQLFHCRWDTFCTMCPFQSYVLVDDHIGQDVLQADQKEQWIVAACSCLAVSSPALLRALECLQSLLEFQHSMCFLSIQSPIASLTMPYGRQSTGWGPVNGESAPFLASSSALSLTKMPSCPGTHTNNNIESCAIGYGYETWSLTLRDPV